MSHTFWLIYEETMALKVDQDTLSFSIYALKPAPITQANQRKVEALLQNVTPHLTAKHIPDLLFLKKKLTQLNGSGKTLRDAIDERLAELEAKRDLKSEDALVEQMSRLCLDESKQTNSAKELKGLKLIAKFLAEQKKHPERILPITLVTLPFLALSKGSTSWESCARALRVAELYLPHKDEVDSPYEKELRGDLEAHDVDFQALLSTFQKQKDVSHLRSLAPFFEIVIGLFECKVQGDLQKTITQLQGLLWRDLLSGKKGNYVLNFIPDGRSLHQVHILAINLAIMINDLLLVECLIASGLDLNTKDDHGYAPSHLAAIFGNVKALTLFRRLGADFTLKNASGATVYDILKSQGYRLDDPKALPKPLPGVKKHSFHSVFTRDLLFRFWLQKKQETPSTCLNPVEKKVFDQYVKDPTSTALELHKSGNTFSLLATREIEAGEFLIEMTGMLKTENELPKGEPKERIFQLPDGTCMLFDTIGSGAEYIQQGPPCCSSFSLIIKGEVHLLFYSIRKIAKGEEIRMNFGRPIFDLSDEEYKEPHTQVVDQFIQDTKKLTYFPFKVSKQEQGWVLETNCVYKNEIHGATIPLQAVTTKDFLDTHYMREMMTYLLDFPEYPLELIRQKKITAAAFYNFLEALRASRHPELHNAEAYCRVVSQIIVAGSLSQRAGSRPTPRSDTKDPGSL